MVRKPKTNTLHGIPVSVSCTVCGSKTKVPANKFSSSGGTYSCDAGRHGFQLSPEAALEAFAAHSEFLGRIVRRNT
jgi:hypothetical protein